MTDMWLPPTIIDLTAKTPKPLRRFSRKSMMIDAIVLHQTAFSRGNDPNRYLEVSAHFVVMPDGRSVQLHPVDSYLVASSAFNNDAISIEFVGNFADDRGHWWEGDTYGRHTPTTDQISGGRDLVRYLKDDNGLSFIFAHRQGEKPEARGNCPGPDIWFNIGEWAISGLGMSDLGKGYTEGHGAAIPDSWRKARETAPAKK
jgi:hypothetical protein